MKSKELGDLAKKAKAASYTLAELSSTIKNRALCAMAEMLTCHSKEVLNENKRDLNANKGLAKALLDRLSLNPARIGLMADSLRQVASLNDPLGDPPLIKEWLRPNGLRIQKVRVPIGVVGIIYESRPNVTSDCIGLCLKSGNVSILRGGREAVNTNMAICKLLSKAARESGLPANAINFINTTEHRALAYLLSLSECIDLIIPRGGEGLIRFVQEHSKIPVIKHYKGICHIFVDEFANTEMAGNICFNAKVSRPGVCNAMESLLVHKGIAGSFLPGMLKRYRDAGVEIRGCPETLQIVKDISQRAMVRLPLAAAISQRAMPACRQGRVRLPLAAAINKAKEIDWHSEYLDLILSVKVVADIDQAVMHINHYGSHHSDAIITENYQNALKFTRQVDSACVYVNASTRFTDGYEFGLGSEIGISTDKIHARGPMALEELTTYKYIIFGTGQIRT
ncbi:MAG: glutamate-5-semialdehyde dehydrogenase [Omnitrophica WOR_2 bacterium RIFCSPHIGHO2_02_FULL_46_37]|nr:MAG: glutamate-5-semialdehyde dehydrogenase [Omnitrophica WOR_2 bacterium RIFCSPHIGHO2_02_FULL_46_37]